MRNALSAPQAETETFDPIGAKLAMRREQLRVNLENRAFLPGEEERVRADIKRLFSIVRSMQRQKRMERVQ